jgi:N-formylglutamate amidohydrolase
MIPPESARGAGRAQGLAADTAPGADTAVTDSAQTGRRRGSVRQFAKWVPGPTGGWLLPLLLLLACSSDSPGEPRTDPVPTALTITAGNGQTAVVATPTGARPTVRVTDQSGAGVPDVTVTFTVTAGDGWITDSSVPTDATGHASTTWYLGPEADTEQTVSASAAGFTAQFSAMSAPLVEGVTYTGAAMYVEFTPGDLPLVISAPHGGTIEPLSIPDRTGSNATVVRDAETDALALAMPDAFAARTGGTPHVIVMHLHRSKVDANREIGEGAENNAAAARAWREYHGFIEAARLRVIEDHGRGFYIDLHGHGHEIPRLELGYLLSASQLGGGDEQLNAASVVERSSIRRLAETGESTHAELLRGTSSLGTLLEARGYPAVPSTSQPDPGGEPYFTGGYSTERHGSRNGGLIDAVQIEANRIGVRDTEGNRQLFAAALAAAMEQFFAAHYELPLAAAALR